MKYCSECGAQLLDEAVFCVKCGCATKNARGFVHQMQGAQSSGTETAVMVLMIVNLVFSVLLAVAALTLAWKIPMLIIYLNKKRRGEQIGDGFKICTLIFFSLIAGILMFCDKEE